MENDEEEQRRPSRDSSHRSSRESEGDADDPGSPHTEVEYEQIDEEKAVLTLQTWFRAHRIKRAFAYVAFLEDEVLEFPRPGRDIAIRLLEEPPPPPAEEDPDAVLEDGAGRDVAADDPFPKGPSVVPQLEAVNQSSMMKKRGEPSPTPSVRGQKKRGAGSPTPSVGGQSRKSDKSRNSGQKGKMSARSTKSGKSTKEPQAQAPLPEPEPEVIEAIVVPESSLASRLVETNALEERWGSPERVAREICLLLGDPQPLDSVTLERIFEHHRRRHRNKECMTCVRLALVVRGDTDQSHAAGMVGDPERVLTPDGMLQATRAGWELRLYPDWAPKLLMSSGERSCIQTSERIRDVLSDNPPGGEEPPAVTVCDELAFPSSVEHLGPEVYRVQDVLPHLVAKTEPPADTEPWSPENSTRPPLPVLAVAGGMIQETLLACLCAKSRASDELGGRRGGGSRFRGGDLLVAQSPRMRGIQGKEFEEMRVTDAELWRRAIRRSNWVVVEHLRGNGKPSERPAALLAEENLRFREKVVEDIRDALAFDPFDLVGEDGELPEDAYADGCDFGRTWRERTGEPLIFSHAEFSRLVVRAGTAYRPNLAISTAVKPLVKDFVPNEERDYGVDVEVDSPTL